MNKPDYPARAQAMAAVQLMTRQPRTCGELAGLLGCSRQSAAIYIRLMVDEGLVAKAGKRHEVLKGPAAVVYAWLAVGGAAC